MKHTIHLVDLINPNGYISVFCGHTPDKGKQNISHYTMIDEFVTCKKCANKAGILNKMKGRPFGDNWEDFI